MEYNITHSSSKNLGYFFMNATCDLRVILPTLNQYWLSIVIFICRGSTSHLLSDVIRKVKQMRVTTMRYLSPQHTTCLVFMNPCASLTKQKHCTRTYSGNIQTMSTVSLKHWRHLVMYGVAQLICLPI